MIDRNGNVIARFASKYTPADPQLVGIVQKALAAK
jgi:glutathione peroxidase-family protein